MATKVQKWGNSLAVRLPKEIAESLSLTEGSSVEFMQRADALLIRRIPKQELKLKDLLARITPENLHPEWDIGEPAGKEVW